ncbi:MAG: galactokinase [Mogibacterium sp.]|nr:galactokinase [Mogibacterium sp.]
MRIEELIGALERGSYADRFREIYVDEEYAAEQPARYAAAVRKFAAVFGGDDGSMICGASNGGGDDASGDVSVYSAPGRSEIGGNHTDHQRGEVLAAAVNRDVIAVVRPFAESVVRIYPEGFDMVEVALDVPDCAFDAPDRALDAPALTPSEEEQGTVRALVKGVLAGLRDRGYQIGGFEAYTVSSVPVGAGLSSSAAYETLIGTVLSGLYNDGKVPSAEVAAVGQFAENVFFGKPCGLMDQMASSVGGMIHVDFADPAAPVVEQVPFDLRGHGYALCITNTGGSHADLTDDYAAVPAEMRRVAASFGKEVLRDVDAAAVLADIEALRAAAGDRSVLRALHFFAENDRVRGEVAALRGDDMDAFLRLVTASGNSSFKYLQNVYTNSDVQHQSISLALALSEHVLGGRGACRVHGGGFAGTVQAFVPDDMVAAYRAQMDAVFGAGACSVLQVRPCGGVRVL